MFEAIEKQNSPDDEALMTRLKNLKSKPHLSTAKNYLKGMLLDSIDEFHRSTSAEEKIKKQIHQGRLLCQRGFVAEGKSLLQKAKAQVISQEKYHLLFELQYWIYGSIKTDLPHEEEQKRLYDESKQNLRVIDEIVELRYLNLRMFSLYAKLSSMPYDDVKKTTEKLMSHPLLQNPDAGLLLKSKLDLHELKSLGYSMLGRRAESTEHLRRIIQLLESQPHRMNDFANVYSASLINFLVNCFHLKHYEELETGLEKLHGLPDLPAFKNVAKPCAVFRHVSSLKYALYWRRGDFEKGLKLNEEVIPRLESCNEKLSRYDRVRLVHMMCCFFFANGKMSEALKWNLELVQAKYFDKAMGELNFARLIHILIHYELGNYELLDSLLKSTERHYKNQEAELEFEIIVVKLMKKVLSAVDISDRKFAFKKMRAELLPLKSLENVKEGFPWFSVIPWLDSKIEDVTFIEAARKRISG